MYFITYFTIELTSNKYVPFFIKMKLMFRIYQKWSLTLTRNFKDLKLRNKLKPKMQLKPSNFKKKWMAFYSFKMFKI